MTTRPWACALVASVLVSCGGRAGLIDGSPGGTKGRGTLAHPAATVHDAGVRPDANVTAGAEGVADVASEAPGIAAGLAAASAPSSVQRQEACVKIDLSTLDRSCHADSDCMLVTGGIVCPSTCGNCGNAAINKDDRPGYEVLITSLPFTMEVCPCPSGPVCTQGLCTYGGSQ